MISSHKKLLLTFSLFFVIMIIYTNVPWSSYQIGNNIATPSKNVYFDLGTNNGDSIKYFLAKSNKMPYSLLKNYEKRLNSKWEIFAFEANSYFNNDLELLKNECINEGHVFHLFNETAAWIKNETIKFYLDTVNFNKSFWGSSVIKKHPDVVKSNQKNVEVRGVDISSLLKQFKKDDEIVMKIDIEGAEYKLLLHLLKQNTLQLIDFIIIEFHKNLSNDVSFKNLEQFFETYFQIFNITFLKWD